MANLILVGLQDILERSFYGPALFELVYKNFLNNPSMDHLDFSTFKVIST